MKARSGFVSNSSSCSFIITNISPVNKTLEDFARENIWLVKEFHTHYDWCHFPEEEFIQSAIARNEEFRPKEPKRLIFGDEQGDVIGHICDYMLRAGGESESFTWTLDEFLR